MKNSIFILYVFMGFSINNILNAQEKKFSNGDIICSDKSQMMNTDWKLCPGHYDEMIIGVYKEPEYSSLQEKQSVAKNPIKREGITNIKFNSENGPIKKGDLITSSSKPGEGMKATQSGMVVGIALEDASGTSGLIKCRVLIQYVKQ